MASGKEEMYLYKMMSEVNSPRRCYGSQDLNGKKERERGRRGMNSGVESSKGVREMALRLWGKAL